MVVALCSCRAETSPARPSTATPSSKPRTEPLRYELTAEVIPRTHELRVTGSFRSETPRHELFLNEALVIDALEGHDGPIGFRRRGSRIDLDRPLSAGRIRYHGQLVRDGARDYKSHAWIRPGEVRLTEITLWYPVVYEGEGDVPWPPHPATGVLTITSPDELSWHTSGHPLGRNTFELREPGDLVLVGVPFPATTYPGRPELRIASPRHDALAAPARSTWNALAAHLGPARTPLITIVEFPATGTSNSLAFLSSDLMVLSSAMTSLVVDDTPRALRMVAHEMAHRWFGGDLRPAGLGVRWLAESFAEYYAWLVVRDRFGEAAYRRVVEDTVSEAGEVPTPILSLDWDDERVYTAGALGVRALADVVGQARLDDVIRRIDRDELPWTVETLVTQLRAAGADPTQLASFERTWGLHP